MQIEEIVRASREQARKIIESTATIREEVRRARPNSSEKSTTEGTLKALEMILNASPANLP